MILLFYSDNLFLLKDVLIYYFIFIWNEYLHKEGETVKVSITHWFIPQMATDVFQHLQGFYHCLRASIIPGWKSVVNLILVSSYELSFFSFFFFFLTIITVKIIFFFTFQMFYMKCLSLVFFIFFFPLRIPWSSLMYEFLFFFTLGEFITVIPSTSFLCTCFFLLLKILLCIYLTLTVSPMSIFCFVLGRFGCLRETTVQMLDWGRIGAHIFLKCSS